jgi:hypothetical protein
MHKTATGGRTMKVLSALLLTCLFVPSATAKYSGGSGTERDPYKIATAADLIALGETPADYDKHFILTADIDLDPNLPGRKVFDKTVIAPAWETRFTGVFDGRARTISHLTIVGKDRVGLFGCLASCAEVKNVGLVEMKISGSGDYVGGLVGDNLGTVTKCHSSGVVRGKDSVGGLVGYSLGGSGTVTQSYSTGAVSGNDYVGGLLGLSEGADVIQCYSGAAVSGTGQQGAIGGLVGFNCGCVAQCYSTGAVVGTRNVGGLAGQNVGSIVDSYARGNVKGHETSSVGGLLGTNGDFGFGGWTPGGMISNCFWDTQTSGQTTSAGGTGKTTVEMQTAKTFLDAGWDFVGETANGTEDIWKILEGRDYPRLWWELPPAK